MDFLIQNLSSLTDHSKALHSGQHSPIHTCVHAAATMQSTYILLTAGTSRMHLLDLLSLPTGYNSALVLLDCLWGFAALSLYRV